MSAKPAVENELVEDASMVWLLKNHDTFAYSEGAAAEQHLDRVLRGSKDLSSRSSELEKHIKDWSSEYHLSTKRGQLLSGFQFDRALKVLEVGCGCGAITRQLGESFDSVTSVEGNLARARLARLRTRDLPSVSIICAPFQTVRFIEKFDIIFVIGVYEYSAWFVAGDTPYDTVLKYFSEMLTPNGMVVIAIENQFGLKYFNRYREDHLNKPFDGIEGYHRQAAKVRTFGKAELESNLRRYFSEVRFFYPYPDYKLPDCVLSAEFVRSEQAGELVSQISSRDYVGSVETLWSESATTLELARNGVLEFFANSFLVFAGRTALKGVAFDQLAILYSSSRKSQFATQTRIVEAPDEGWVVSKRLRCGAPVSDGGTIRWAETDAPWLNTQSLFTQIALRAMSKDRSLDEIFEPCRRWVKSLIAVSRAEEGRRHVDGTYVDSIWPNVYPDEPEVHLIDREWTWHRDVSLNVLVIRAIFDCLSRLEMQSVRNKLLKTRSGKTLIKRIASSIGIELDGTDFDDFVVLEAEIQSIVFGTDTTKLRMSIRWFLTDRPTLALFRRSRQAITSMAVRVQSRLPRRS